MEKESGITKMGMCSRDSILRIIAKGLVKWSIPMARYMRATGIIRKDMALGNLPFKMAIKFKGIGLMILFKNHIVSISRIDYIYFH